MKNKILKYSFIAVLIFMYTSIPVCSHPVNPSLSELSSPRNRIFIGWESYRRKTAFFFGLNKHITVTGPTLTYGNRSHTGMDYYITLHSTAVDIDGRETRDNGFTARLGFGREIWGDLIVLPLVKWTLDAAYSNISLREYNGSSIDISLQSTSIDLALFAALKKGPLVPYLGMKFYYSADDYTEEQFDIDYSSDSSGAGLLAGLKAGLSESLSVSLEGVILDERSFSAGLEYEF